MGFEPLYEASLRALPLQAHFPGGPHCGRGSSRAGLSPGFFPLRGPTHVLRVFLCWRPRQSRSPIPSLTPSWWSPCPLLRRALLPLSGYVMSVPSAFSLRQSRLSIPFALSSLSRHVFADGICPLRMVAFAAGASPHALVRRCPGVSRWHHLYRLPPNLVSLRGLDVRHLGLRSVFTTFTCTAFRMYS